MSRHQGEALLGLLVIAWSLNISANKYALLHGFSPLEYVASRDVVAAVALGALTLQREGTLVIDRHDGPRVIVAAALGLVLNPVFSLYSLRFSGAIVMAVVFGTAPVLTACIAWLMRIEVVNVRKWAGVGLSTVGVALFAVGIRQGGGLVLLGAVLSFGAALSWAAYSVMLMVGPQKYSALRVTSVMMLSAAVPLIAWAVPLTEPKRLAAITTTAWPCWIYSTVVSFGVATAGWTAAVMVVGASRAAMYNNLQPFLGALFAALLLSEGVTAVAMVGGAVVAAGVLVGSGVGPGGGRGGGGR